MTQNFTRPYPAPAPGDFGGTFSAGFYQWKTQDKLKIDTFTNTICYSL